MTLNRYPLNRFALSPKVCDRCDRRFVLEPYRRVVGLDKALGRYTVQYIKCRDCTKEFNDTHELSKKPFRSPKEE